MSKIILDPTGSYPPKNHYTVISTEVEWLKNFTLEHEYYLIQGKALCKWTEEWLRVWNKLDLIVDTKQPQINNKQDFTETVIVNCVGKCEGLKPGELTITIHNYDTITLINLQLKINELPNFQNVKLSEFTIPPQDQIIHQITISEYPQLPPDKNTITIPLSGKISFGFNDDHLGESKLGYDSYLTIKQIYNSGFQGDLDDF
ncbi:hypothetical protein IQ227_10730 [Anabaena aphanizomenioides LEGE 00250]|uniref:Uncharacterized protein n=1 Tax=Sphaerospermopsis aphanizomenoides LEGE 00250 TaxID=2777972 RepID=A0ABR9VDB1_9CYAN|nr:hypothetical protein [Sphaerospermopsis aphanizomenoides]MBE9236483.1 hypothetical protein [Sphaerospermopsis aphanizomenoides LEGE 00250]